jgi:hypothetical protein
MEVTGCCAEHPVWRQHRFSADGLLVSFGGLSIMAQIASAVHGTG